MADSSSSDPDRGHAADAEQKREQTDEFDLTEAKVLAAQSEETCHGGGVDESLNEEWTGLHITGSSYVRMSEENPKWLTDTVKKYTGVNVTAISDLTLSLLNAARLPLLLG